MGIKSYPVIDLVATGKNITRLRKEHGYSVAELQEFFGFEAPQAIYKWQQGKTLPSTDNLFALSRFLEVSIEEILVAEKPKFQVLPQEESCGSGFLGENIIRESKARIIVWYRIKVGYLYFLYLLLVVGEDQSVRGCILLNDQIAENIASLVRLIIWADDYLNDKWNFDLCHLS